LIDLKNSEISLEQFKDYYIESLKSHLKVEIRSYDATSFLISGEKVCV